MCGTFITIHVLNNITRWSFCDIQNNQGWGRGYQPKLKADIPYKDLDYSGYHKKPVY